jgi:hypothetical protein
VTDDYSGCVMTTVPDAACFDKCGASYAKVQRVVVCR